MKSCSNLSLHRPTGQRGFTVLEMLVAFGLLALVVTIAIPVYRGFREDARTTVNAADLRLLNEALAIYRFENNDAPVLIGDNSPTHNQAVLAAIQATQNSPIRNTVFDSSKLASSGSGSVFRFTAFESGSAVAAADSTPTPTPLPVGGTLDSGLYVINGAGIGSLKGGTATDLDGLGTGSLAVNSRVLVTVAGKQYAYELENASDAEALPTVVRPNDYSASSPRVWRLRTPFDTLQNSKNLSDIENPATALNNLGAGTIAVQDADAVSITGGTAKFDTNGLSVGNQFSVAGGMVSVDGAMAGDLSSAFRVGAGNSPVGAGFSLIGPVTNFTVFSSGGGSGIGAGKVGFVDVSASAYRMVFDGGKIGFGGVTNPTAGIHSRGPAGENIMRLETSAGTRVTETNASGATTHYAPLSVEGAPFKTTGTVTHENLGAGILVTDASGQVSAVDAGTAIGAGGFGTMAYQNANNVNITGGTINNTMIGNLVPSSGAFTTLGSSGATNLSGKISAGILSESTFAHGGSTYGGGLSLLGPSRNFTLYSSGASSPLGAGAFGLYDATSNTHRMVVDGSGRVGFGGILSPASSYQFRGVSGQPIASFETSGGAPAFALDSAGNGTFYKNVTVNDGNVLSAPGGGLYSRRAGGTLGGSLLLQSALTSTAITGDLDIVIDGDLLRFRESGGIGRGFYLDFAGATASHKILTKAEFDPSVRRIDTVHSVQGGGDLSADRTISLVGDVAAPGANKVYGTDAAGARGWVVPVAPPDLPIGGTILYPSTAASIDSGRFLRLNGQVYDPAAYPLLDAVLVAGGLSNPDPSNVDLDAIAFLGLDAASRPIWAGRTGLFTWTFAGGKQILNACGNMTSAAVVMAFAAAEDGQTQAVVVGAYTTHSVGPPQQYMMVSGTSVAVVGTINFYERAYLLGSYILSPNGSTYINLSLASAASVNFPTISGTKFVAQGKLFNVVGYGAFEIQTFNPATNTWSDVGNLPGSSSGFQVSRDGQRWGYRSTSYPYLVNWTATSAAPFTTVPSNGVSSLSYSVTWRLGNSGQVFEGGNPGWAYDGATWRSGFANPNSLSFDSWDLESSTLRPPLNTAGIIRTGAYPLAMVGFDGTSINAPRQAARTSSGIYFGHENSLLFSSSNGTTFTQIGTLRGTIPQDDRAPLLGIASDNSYVARATSSGYYKIFTTTLGSTRYIPNTTSNLSVTGAPGFNYYIKAKL